MKVADYIFRFVADQGVKHVFVVVGGGAMHLNEALSREKRIEFICNSHEQASAICAENYAKATDNLGCALVTTGPGGTNAITGLAGAWLDSTPVLFISGQVKRADRMFQPDGTPIGVRQLGPQEVDIVGLAGPLTKYAATVLDPQDIRYHLEKAVHLARDGRPGPVWLDIPLDVQAALIDEGSMRAFYPAKESGHQCRVDKALVTEVIDRFNQAERPAADGWQWRAAFRGYAGIAGSDAAPPDPDGGHLGGKRSRLDRRFAVCRASRIAGIPTIQNCDFLLIVGARMDSPLTGFAPKNLARAAWKAMADVDATEIAKLEGALHCGIQADAGAFLRELIAQKASIKPKDRSAWRARVAEWQQRYPLITEEHRKPDSPVSVFHLAEILSQEVNSDDCIVSGSSGSGIEIFIFSYPTRAGQRVYHTAGLGAMGFGLPASIGVALAKNRRRTICVDGDGGFQLNIQELETVARLRLPLKFLVLNNDGYASIRASQNAWFGREFMGGGASTGITVPDLSRVASSYGIASYVIENQCHLRENIRRVLEMPGPVVVDVRVIKEEVRGPRLQSMQLPDGRIVSKPLEDLWPYLPRQEFLANMIIPPAEE